MGDGDVAKADAFHRALQVLGELLFASAGVLILIGAAIDYDRTQGTHSEGSVITSGILFLIAGGLIILGALLRFIDSARNYFQLDYKYAAERLEILADILYLAGGILFLIGGALYISNDSGVVDAASIVWIIATSLLVAAAFCEYNSDQYSLNSRWKAGDKDADEARGRTASVIGSFHHKIGFLLLLLGAIILTSRNQNLDNLAWVLWIVGGAFIIAGAIVKAIGVVQEY